MVSHLPDIRRALDAEVQKCQRQAYLDALVAQTELLELAGIVDTGGQERPKLQEIFVALTAAEEVEEHDERQPKGKRERERPIKITHRVTIDQALREHRNLMILGDPGAGKSTLSRYLTLVAAQGMTDGVGADLRVRPGFAGGTLGDHTGSPLPISIRLSSFARSGQSLVEYFETYAEKQLHVSLGEKFFERALEKGEAIVCLDGLDEVSQPARRIDVRNAITALAARYPRNRLIVTSRVAGYDSASLDKRAFAHHTIVPFGEKEIQSFAEKWYAARECEPDQAKTRATKLFNDLKANARLLKLAENPLTLTIIALVHQRAQGKLPEARVELYDRCADTLIEEWDKWKGLAPDDRARPYYQLRRRLLGRTAYWMHIESQDADVAQVSKRALEMKVAEFLVEDKTLNLSEDTARIQAKQFVALATNRTGVLVGREQGAVSFIHLTFQEYFAASDLYWRYRKTPDALWQAIQPHLYDSRWLEVILLLLGRLNDEGDTPSIIVEKILREQDKFDEVLHRNLFLAARCLADRVNVKEPLQAAITDQLIEFASAGGLRYWSLQEDAIHTLGTLQGDKRAGDVLLTLAQGVKGNLLVQYSAAQALGQLGRTEDAARLLLALAQDEKTDPFIRSAPAQALGQLGRSDDAVIQGLLALAQGEKINEWVRRGAARALGELGHTDDAVRLFIALAQDKKEQELERISAAPALGQLGHMGDAVIRGLLALTQDAQESKGVRSAAAQALGQLGHMDDAVIRGLLTLAQDAQEDKGVRKSAVYALGELGYTDDAVIRGILTLAQDAQVDEELQSNAVYALGELGHTDGVVIQGILQLVQDEKMDARVRRAAAYALGWLGRRDDAVRLLLALVQDEKVGWGVRRDAAQALGQLGCTDDAARLLLALAQDEKVDGDVRYDAAQALGQLGRTDDAAIHSLLALAQDEKVDEWMRCDAAQALGQLGRTDDAVVHGLLALAQDANCHGNVRYAAAQALDQLGRTDDAAIDGLLALAQDEKVGWGVRRDAAQALDQLGKIEQRVELGLLELASGGNSEVRNAAYDALKEVVGNLRYAEVDNGQQRIKRTGWKGLQRTRSD